MLYDDDRGGSPFEPIDPRDNRQWAPPMFDRELMERFDVPDRVLLLLSGDAAAYAYSDDQLYEALGMVWDRDIFDDLVDQLATAGLVWVEEEDDERWLSITADGLDRVDALING